VPRGPTREHGEAQIRFVTDLLRKCPIDPIEENAQRSVGKSVSAKCQFHMTRDHFECGISGDQTCEWAIGSDCCGPIYSKNKA
jgi:hypothetical protein